MHLAQRLKRLLTSPKWLLLSAEKSTFFKRILPRWFSFVGYFGLTYFIIF